jgi:hypothetical protein
MKKLLFILLTVIYLTTSCHNEHAKKDSILKNTSYGNSIRDTVFTVKSINDTTGILKLCFSPIKILNKKIAVWKPTTDDFFNMPISDDSLCHTKIDTIIKLLPDKYIILFRTDSYHHNGKIIDCHVCSPDYGIATNKKGDSSYQIMNFKKNLIAAGSFGNGYDTLSVEDFGKNHKLLMFSSSYTGTSTNTTTNTFFELEYYTQVFSYCPYREVGDSSELDENYSELEQHLIKIPGVEKEDNNDIKLEGTKVLFDRKTKKIKRIKQIEYYRDDDFGIYSRALN